MMHKWHLPPPSPLASHIRTSSSKNATYGESAVTRYARSLSSWMPRVRILRRYYIHALFGCEDGRFIPSSPSASLLKTLKTQDFNTISPSQPVLDRIARNNNHNYNYPLLVAIQLSVSVSVFSHDQDPLDFAFMTGTVTAMAQLPRIDPYDGSIAFDPWYTRFQGQLRQLAPGGLSPNGSMRVQANMVLRNCSPGVEGVLSSLETLMNKKTAATWKYWTITRFRAFVPAIKTQIEIERKGKEAARQGLWGYLQRAALITAFIAGIAAILLPFTAFLNLYLNMQMTKGKMTQEIATVIYLSLSSMVVVDADVGSVGSCLWSFVVTIVIAAGVGWMFGFVGAYVWYLFKESRRPSHSWEDGVRFVPSEELVEKLLRHRLS